MEHTDTYIHKNTLHMHVHGDTFTLACVDDMHKHTFTYVHRSVPSDTYRQGHIRKHIHTYIGTYIEDIQTFKPT